MCEHPRALQEQGPVRFYAQDQPVSLLQIQPVPYVRWQNDPPPVSALEGMALLSERCRVGHPETIPPPKDLTHLLLPWVSRSAILPARPAG
jgi:hypothetical protein